MLKAGSRALARVLPNAQLRELAGVSHNVKMRVLAPVVADFITGETRTVVPGELTRVMPR